MRAINLYTISRKINGELMPLYEKALSDREEVAKVRKEEIDLIGVLVNNFIFHRVKGNYYEDWFYSFSIPQIGKEFDLLKISVENGL